MRLVFAGFPFRSPREGWILRFVFFVCLLVCLFSIAPWAEASAEGAERLFFPDGSVYSVGDKTANLSSMPSDSLRDCIPLLQKMTALRSISLGRDSDRPQGDVPFSWEDIAALQEALPGLRIHYRFTLYGKEFTLRDTEMNLSHVPVDDEGEGVRTVLPCMKKCRLLDMDFCGVPSETMAGIRDAFPDIEVVWRIWFGGNCSVRTDCTRIMASAPIYSLKDDNTQDLQYCTKVKYLDLGHNETLHNYSYIANMPELEVCILAITGITDLTPLENCKKLEYLELNNCPSGLDLSPLAGCTNLRHLNICWLYGATGFRALGELKQLERLWIGAITEISDEDVEYLRAALPNTEINTTEQTGCNGSWREEPNGGLVERYVLLRKQFDYDHYGLAVSTYYNDPLYFENPQDAMIYRGVPFS